MNFKRNFLIITCAILLSISAHSADSNGKIIIIPLNGFDNTTVSEAVGGNFKKTLGEQRLQVFTHAAFLWSTILDLDFDVTVEVDFSPLKCEPNSVTLGFAGPETVIKINDVWNSTAQGNQILKSKSSGSYNDIYATFNSSIDDGCFNGSPDGWYYGLDNIEPSGQEALLDVVLHEIGHGLGFVSLVNGETGELFSGFIDAYSKNLEDKSISKNWSTMTDGERLNSSSNNSLGWDGVNATNDVAEKGITNGIIGGSIKMYAPTRFNSGSSISHISTESSPSQLMEPFNTLEGAYPDLEIPMFKDIGYKIKSELTGNTIPVAKSYSVNVPFNGSKTLNFNTQSKDDDSADTVFFLNYLNKPANGTIDDMYDGLATYTPNEGFSGSDTVKWQVYDSKMTLSNEGTITFIVPDLNKNPTAIDDLYDVTSSKSSSLAVLLNDFDNDSDGFIDSSSLNIISQPTNGIVEISGNFIRYQSENDYKGKDSFTYTVSDNEEGVSNTATVFLNVYFNDVRATVNNDNFSFESNSINSLESITNNDSDTDSETSIISRFSIKSSPSNGTISFIDGIPHYTPNNNYIGGDTLTYKINGEGHEPLDSLDATISITVVKSNTAPVAIEDSATTNEDTTVKIEVLSNDTDSDGDALTYSNITISQASNGAVFVDGNSLKYSPNSNYNGSDQFSYTVNDGFLNSNSATVSITVNSVIDPAKTFDFNINILEDSTTVTESLLPHFSVGDSAFESFNIVEGALHGTVSIIGTDIKYTPDNDFEGNDIISYVATDVNGLISNTSIFTVMVLPINDDPIAVADSFSVSRSATNLNVIGNDFDAEDSVAALSVIIQSNPFNGVLSVSGANVSYLVNDDSLESSDSFSYLVKDNDGASSNIVTVEIGIFNSNPPTANLDVYSLSEDESFLSPVTENDTADTDRTFSSVRVSVPPLNGTTTISGINITYIPNSNFSGEDTFTYILSDDLGLESNTSKVTFNIAEVNDTPIAFEDSLTVTRATQTDLKVLLNDFDESIETVVIVIVSEPSQGTFFIEGGIIKYTSNEFSNSSSDSLTYKTVDSEGLESNVVNVDINITNTTPAPVGRNDSYTIKPNTTSILNILNNDTIGTTSNSINIISGVDNGTLYVYSDYVEYESLTDGNDSFSYTVTDELSQTSGVTTVDIIINSNHLLNLNDDFVNVNEDGMIVIDAMDNDNISKFLNISIISTPEKGSVIINKDNNFEYATLGNVFGKDSFDYQVEDTSGAISIATVFVNIISDESDFLTLPDTFTLSEDSNALLNVLFNDTIEILNFIIVINNFSSNGGIEITDNNSFKYTPNANFNGEDSFTYSILNLDSNTESNTSIVNLLVSGVNDNPIAEKDLFFTIGGAPLELTILNNDNDIDGDNLTINIVTSPKKGTLTNINKAIFYKAPFNFEGTDTFTYFLSDSNGGESDIVNVLINITKNNNNNNQTTEFEDKSSSGGVLGILFLISLFSLTLLYRNRDKYQRR
jgi:hypothetical protein